MSDRPRRGDRVHVIAAEMPDGYEPPSAALVPPGTSPGQGTDLRDPIHQAITAHCTAGGDCPRCTDLENAVMAEVQPELDQQAAEVTDLEDALAEVQANNLGLTAERDHWRTEAHKLETAHQQTRAELATLRAYHQQIGDLP